MYGIIFRIFMEMFVTKLGEEKWKELLMAAKLENNFKDTQNYKDEDFFVLVEAAATLLSVPEVELMEAVGYWSPMYYKKAPFGKLMFMVGNKSLGEFLQNVNSLHGHVKASSFPELQMPNIRVTQMKETSFFVHYTPGNQAREAKLKGYFTGFIKGLGEMHLNLKNLVVKQKKFLPKDPEDVFYVKWSKPSHSSADLDELNYHIAQNLNLVHGIPAKTVATIFPFHLVFNKRFEVIQFGRSLSKLVPTLCKGSFLPSHFSIVSPKEANFDSFKALLKIARADPILFGFQSRDHTSQGGNSQLLQIQLKGQVVGIEKESLALYVCSPLVPTADIAHRLGLELSDFAIHDPTKDLLFVREFKDLLKPFVDENKERSTLGVGGGGCPFNSSGNSNNQESNHVPINNKPINGSQPIGSRSSSSKSIVAPGPELGEHGGNLLNKLFGSTCSSISEIQRQKEIERDLYSLDSSDDSSRPASTRRVYTSADRLYNGFVELLLEDSFNNFDFVKTILEQYTLSNNCDSMFGSVIRFYYNYDRMDQFLTSVIQDEINNPKFKSDPNSVFRSHTVPATLIAVYMKLFGRKFLSSISNSLVEQVKSQLKMLNSKFNISSSPPDSSPSGIKTKQLKPNEIKLVTLCTSTFISSLIHSTDSIPLPIRRLLRLIAKESTMFPRSELPQSKRCTPTKPKRPLHFHFA
eukprot:TRINITY_DN6941_c0_g2_i2.p1 TRINITY_DN6941_c0_g2~~TRINITY_DN6941_c0_g2_i2.p1  ORF type:complete len:692 (-),score=104.61 TRINITY_DN6941_c0_g2_i2:60-2135(-)